MYKKLQINWNKLLLLSMFFCFAANAFAEAIAVHRDDWYLAQSDEYATIQLSGHESEEAAIAYIEANMLAGDIGYYETTYKDLPWFAVTSGVFRTVAEARIQVKSLPMALRHHSPWPRSFAEIKSLITPAAKNAAVNKKGIYQQADNSVKAESVPKPGWEDGQAAYDKGDFSSALKIWHILAEQGDSLSQFNLGVMYSRGEGTRQDGKQAVEWYKRSAELGYAPAQFNLGAAYLEGKFVTADKEQAATWWLTAAEQGFVQAQFNIASLYCRGIGVPRDVGKCKYWYGRAAANGDTHARKMLDLIATNERAAKSEAGSKKIAQPVARGGTANASTTAKPGERTEKKEVIRKISAEEQILLRKAQAAFTRSNYKQSHDIWLPLAESGIAEAQYSLGFLYHSGWGLDQDLLKAVDWYTRAAEQDETRAQFNLGVLLLSREAGVEQDLETGMSWLTRSAEGGNTRAKEFLIDTYSNGNFGIEKSQQKAEYWKSL